MNSDPFREGPLMAALRQMFNGDVAGSQEVLKGYVAATPRDPLGFALSATVPFYAFVGGRMKPQGKGSMQELIVGKGIGVPENFPVVRAAFQQARRLADVDLQADPRDQNALLALCIVESIERDVLVLIHKRWMAGLQHAKAAALNARRLLEVNPAAYDAYYVIGLSEYVMAQVPALFRPFAKIPGVVGEKSRALQFLEAVAREGWYLRDFGRQMLVSVYLEERRREDAAQVLEGLTQDYGGNVGFRAELESDGRAT
jgi:hypothetical protein